MITWFSSKKTTKTAKKDDFVSLASHQLRSPLSIIKWYTEILLDGDAGAINEEQRKYLTVIESSNQRAIDLIRSLLNVSRLDLGTFSVTPEEIVLADMVKASTDIFCKEAAKKHVEVIYTEGEGIMGIKGDKHICMLVIKQLLSNAIIFSPEGGEVEVKTTLLPKHSQAGIDFVDEDCILLTVTDTGLGIPEKDTSKIFTRMFRASNVKDSEGSDSGLGLYITKTVVEITGGKIWFDSEEGKGTTFYVALPVKGPKKKEGTTVLE